MSGTCALTSNLCSQHFKHAASGSGPECLVRTSIGKHGSIALLQLAAIEVLDEASDRRKALHSAAGADWASPGKPRRISATRRRNSGARKPPRALQFRDAHEPAHVGSLKQPPLRSASRRSDGASSAAGASCCSPRPFAFPALVESPTHASHDHTQSDVTLGDLTARFSLSKTKAAPSKAVASLAAWLWP